MNIKNLFGFLLILLLSFFSLHSVFAKNDLIRMNLVDLTFTSLTETEETNLGNISKKDFINLFDQANKFQISVDGNKISGKFYAGLGFNTENEKITVDADINAKIDASGKISGEITGKGRSYDVFYGGGAGEWTDNLCRPYGWDVFTEFPIEGTYDFTSKIITLKFNQCGSAELTFSSSEPVDLVSCEEDEVYVDEKCKPISDFCSDDELVNYNVAEKKCFCPVGYKLTDKKTCEEVEEMLYEVSYPEQQPPFLMDGKEYKIKVSIKNGETGQPMKATRLSINYTSAPKQGEITNIQELSVGEYLLTYKSAIIEAGNMNGWIDGLYIFYDSKLEGKEIYKTYEIPLGTGVPIKIRKDGFQDITSAIVFAEDRAQIKVVIKNKAGEKVPVYDANVILDSTIVGEETDKEGIAILQSPEEIMSDTKQEILEVVLVPTEEISQRQSKALEQYKQIIQGENPLASPEIRTFIEDFPTYLAQIEDDEAGNALIGLKRVAYTLLYMTEGKNLINDISVNVAGSLKNQLTDTLDLIGASEKAGEYLGKKIEEETIMQKLLKFAPSINKKLGEIGVMLEEKAMDTIKIGIKQHAPDFKAERANELIGIVFGTYGRDAMLQKGVEEIQKVSNGAIEKIIKEYLMESFDGMLSNKMNELEKMIQMKNFSSAGFEADIALSKIESLNLRSKYMTAHELSYDISMIKNYADLANSTLGEALKITQIYKKYAEAAEKGYKAIRSLFLNNAEVYYRADLYGKFMSEVEANVDRGIGIAYIPNHLYKENNQNGIFGGVYASEAEMTKDQLSYASMYRGSEVLLKIQDIILDINNMLLEVYPGDKDLLYIEEEVGLNKVEEEKLIEDLGAQAKIDSEIIKKELGSDSESLTVGERITLIIILGIMVGLVLFVRGIIKKIKTRKNNK